MCIIILSCFIVVISNNVITLTASITLITCKMQLMQTCKIYLLCTLSSYRSKQFRLFLLHVNLVKKTRRKVKGISQDGIIITHFFSISLTRLPIGYLRLSLSI